MSPHRLTDVSHRERTHMVDCPVCHGTGEGQADRSSCAYCRGRGWVYESTPYRACYHCGGTGQSPTLHGVRCGICGGNGELPA